MKSMAFTFFSLGRSLLFFSDLLARLLFEDEELEEEFVPDLTDFPIKILFNNEEIVKFVGGDRDGL